MPRALSSVTGTVSLRWFDSKIANGLIEGINSLVQAAKAKARGYRSRRRPNSAPSSHDGRRNGSKRFSSWPSVRMAR